LQNLICKQFSKIFQVKSLLLRRTKDQKSSVTGEQIVPLPEKETIVHRMKLGPEENKVYQEVSFNLLNRMHLYVFIHFLAL
jgi:SNF2 family DNA or RNA helicase